MAAYKRSGSDLDDIRARFGDVLARKQGHQRAGRAHTDGGSKVAGRGVAVARQEFRRKTG